MKIRAPYLKSSRSLVILLPLLFILLHFMGCVGPFSVYKEQKGIMKTRVSHTTWGLPEGAKARLNKGFILEIAYSPDSTLLAVESSIGVWLYDVQTGEARNLLTGHTGRVRGVSFTPDGQTLASGSSDGTVLLWDLTTK